ncbi:MAG: DUF1801 domain-containing protein [Thermoplasmata archaeon]|nr:DUF1801 domain-containing protein [Thermoplasmata archaeon]
MKSTKKVEQSSVKRTSGNGTKGQGFTDEELDAMKERARELKAAARPRPGADKLDGTTAVLEKIAGMPEPDRTLANRLHVIITQSAPVLTARLWYGMPAYAKDGNVLCFFQPASKFKMRYATLGFSDEANLDAGAMWPNAYALMELRPAGEQTIAGLVKRAVS